MSAISDLKERVKAQEETVAEARKAEAEHRMQEHLERVAEFLGPDVMAELEASSEWSHGPLVVLHYQGKVNRIEQCEVGPWLETAVANWIARVDSKIEQCEQGRAKARVKLLTDLQDVRRVREENDELRDALRQMQEQLHKARALPAPDDDDDDDFDEDNPNEREMEEAARKEGLLQDDYS